MNCQNYEINFFCSACGTEQRVSANFGGMKINCVSCDKEIIVPIPGLEKDLEIGEFVLIRKLGSGGMGEVWLADQQSMQRRVALKILHPHLAEDDNFVSRFMVETRNAGKLQHPNIITAYTAGGIGNYYYLATYYVDGIELMDKLKLEGVLAEREALHIIHDIAGALKYAWEEHGMLHRDVKPGNIMLDKHEIPYLMDMGIATIVAEDHNFQTSSSMVIGTPDYISPEQARNLPDLDFRSDVYSLGATLYHLVAGVPPYAANTLNELLKMHVEFPVPDPRHENNRISTQCAALIKIMMAKDRRDRQTLWSYVIADIDAVLDGRSPIGVGVSRRSDQNHPDKIKYSAPDAPVHLTTNKTVKRRAAVTTAQPVASSKDRENVEFPETESPSPASDWAESGNRDSSSPPRESRGLQPHPASVLPRRVFDANKKRRLWIRYVVLILLLLLLYWVLACYFIT